MNERKSLQTIGIVGGIGPYAGLYLNKKIYDNTISCKDQDHISVILASFPSTIPDRTAYLQGKIKKDPVPPLIKIIKLLHQSGATIVGIACHTAHASKIFDKLDKHIKNYNANIKLMHLPIETIVYVNKKYPKSKIVGVLATSGTVKSNVYDKISATYNIKIVYPNEEIQENYLMPAIYDPSFGIKASSDIISNKAKTLIKNTMDHLINNGAQIIILACTELPLAIETKTYKNKPVIDATTVFARALIAMVAPDKLKVE